MSINPELLAILACPSCKGDLDLLTEAEKEIGLHCKSCQLVFPIKEEIPIMLKEDAVQWLEWEAGKRG